MFVHQICEKEAKNIVKEWFHKNDIPIKSKDIKIIWLALIENGYRCMATIPMYPNLFFEIVCNKKSNEIICTCLNRFEYFIKPSSTDPINFFPTSHKKPILK